MPCEFICIGSQCSRMKTITITKSSVDEVEGALEGDCSDKALSTDSLLPKNDGTLRAKLRHLVSTNKFQICVICLVIIDCLFVVSELLIDLNILGSATNAGLQTTAAAVLSNGTARQTVGTANEASFSLAVRALHYASIAVLCVFVVEVCLKVFAFGRGFFSLKMEIVDSLIIVVTFSLDVALADGTGALSGIGLLIALRLWRVTKILNGIVMSVKAHADKQLLKEKAWRRAAEDELARLVDCCVAQEHEIEALRTVLAKNGIESPKQLQPAATTLAQDESIVDMAPI